MLEFKTLSRVFWKYLGFGYLWISAEHILSIQFKIKMVGAVDGGSSKTI
jgi:hypothetical protein